jgi:HAE1 family hydrophobic/amphiphilic exporter-1
VIRSAVTVNERYRWPSYSNPSSRTREKLTGNELYYLFGLSVLLVYLCLAGQYESWILIGHRRPFMPDVPSAGHCSRSVGRCGCVRATDAAIEMAREGRIVQGKPIREAAVEASRLRFRPILMTSFAFGMGVLPLVLATGAGATAIDRLD